MRDSRPLTDEETSEVLRLQPSMITFSFLRAWFSSQDGKPAKFEPEDTLRLPAGKLGNKTSILTTVGRYVVNLFLLERMRDTIPYVNTPMTKKVLGKLNASVVDLVLTDVISEDTYVDFIDRMNWMGFAPASIFITGYTEDAIKCPPRTAALRKKLFTEHAEKLADGDVKTVSEVEAQLIKLAKEELKDSPIMNYYASGARGTFENNFSNMVLMRGLVADETRPGKFMVSLSNLMDGTPPEDQTVAANILIQAGGARAIDTAKSGYMSKILLAAFQGVVLDERDSDCGTKDYLEIEIPSGMAEMFKYRFVMERGKLIRLDPEILEDYAGKTVKLRSPMFCRGKQYCNKCYGDLPYLIGIKNVGLTINAIGESLKRFSLKAFHDASVKTAKMDVLGNITPLRG